MARYQEILLEDGSQVQLRLTTGKLEQYLSQVNGSNENPLLAVLDAMTILPKRIKLFTAALQWPDNKNTIKNGAELLDRLLDEGVTAREIRNMVLQMAAQAGLADEDQLDEMIQSAQEGDEKFFALISGTLAGKDVAGAEAAEQAAVPSVPAETKEPETTDSAAGTIDLKNVLRTVWLCGAAGVFCWFLGCELVYRRRLRRCARLISASQRGCPAVFVSPAAGSPCLFGLLRPAIYLTPETDADETARHHCLAHEQTHYRHGDHIWSALRCVCLALHWFDPLVWWAAALSRTDAELACDVDAVRALGEAERAAYGRTLLQMTCRGHAGLLSAATTMSGNGSQLRARIRAIAKPVKPALPALLAAALIAVFAAGCTMTGGVTQETPASETEPPEALIEARIEDAKPADGQLNALLEKAGASVLSDSEQTAFYAYLLGNYDKLEGRGVFNAEARWTAERLSDTAACLTIYRPDAPEEVLDELIYHGETGLVSNTRFRCYQASVGDDAPENVRTYTYNALLSSVYQRIPFECFADYLDGHYDEFSPLGLWSYDTVWSISMTEREMRLTISGLPDGGSEAFTLDLDTMLVR